MRASSSGVHSSRAEPSACASSSSFTEQLGLGHVRDVFERIGCSAVQAVSLTTNQLRLAERTNSLLPIEALAGRIVKIPDGQ